MNNIKIRNIFAHVFKQQENLQMPKFHFERENPTLKKLDSKMKTNFHEPKKFSFRNSMCRISLSQGEFSV